MLERFYDSLERGDKVRIHFRDGIMGGITAALTVTSGHRVVGKEKVGRIILKPTDAKRATVKYYLYNRDGEVSFAVGDMATNIVGFEKVWG